MNGCDLHIEACQTEGTEGTKEGAGNDAHPAQLMELVGVDERTGCDTEGNIIGEGVELAPMGPAVCNARATLPSSASATIAISMKIAARS